MKQSYTLIASVIICSVLFVLLMWAPFTFSLTVGQVIKYALIGAGMGLVFYVVALRKAVSRSRAVSRPVQRKQFSKKGKRSRVHG